MLYNWWGICSAHYEQTSNGSKNLSVLLHCAYWGMLYANTNNDITPTPLSGAAEWDLFSKEPPYSKKRLSVKKGKLPL